MTTYFDIHEWNYEIYDTVAEVRSVLEHFGVYGKRISNIHVVGAAEEFNDRGLFLEMRRQLANRGVSYEDIDSGRYPHIERTPLPREVRVCEPVVFVFEDGSTLEMMPTFGGRMRLSANQINKELLDGTNESNFHAERMFKSAKGCSVSRVRLSRTRDLEYNGIKEYYRYEFSFTEKGGTFYIQETYYGQRFDGWYQIGMDDEMLYGEVKDLTKGVKQALIVEGHDGGSCFWVMPIRQEQSGRLRTGKVTTLHTEEISIEEMDVLRYLSHYLYKYFDASFPYICRDDGGEAFEWNLEHNIYTYDTVRRMLTEIREEISVLKAELQSPTSVGQKDREAGWDTQVAIHFYERFCRRMEAMMKHTPRFQLISFMGP